MNRYPHLPEALHQLAPFQGTPSELYEALEPYRKEPWPANPISLSRQLQLHAHEHGLEVETWHTGKSRMIRLARASNESRGEPEAAYSGEVRLTEQNLGQWVEAKRLVLEAGGLLALGGWPALLRATPSLVGGLEALRPPLISFNG